MIIEKLGPCPYDKKPCPGTREGCISWGTWETASMYDSTIGGKKATMEEGCRALKLTRTEMVIEEKPKPKRRKAAKK